MYSIGVTREPDVVRVAVLKRQNGQMCIESLHSLSSDSVQQFYNLPPLHTPSAVRIASTLPSRAVCIRSLQLPLRGKRNILKALPFQLETLFPYPSEEKPIICTQILPQGQQGSWICLCATTEAEI